MALMSVTVNGQVFVVDSHSKSAARAFGATKVEIDVAEANAAQITEFVKAGGEIVTLEKREKKVAEVAAPAEAAAE